MGKQSAELEVRNISQVFVSKNKPELAIDDVSFSVEQNEFLVLLGPGECGKTVLLNIISGLLKPTAGSVIFNGKESNAKNPNLGYVFQNLGILPWLTVRDNVSLSMKYKKVKKAERYELCQKYINLVGLTGFEKYYPHQLSGGMKQRVGIARAYASDPQILLLDEPFGKLDAQTRYSMQEEILRIWNEYKKTVIFVTNNIEEAVYLADRIILFSKRPMSVKGFYDMKSMQRPRDYTGKDFLKIRQNLSDSTELVIE